MKSPDTHRLLTWITGPPGTYLRPRIPAPPGHWIVCGYGRFGSEVVRAIKEAGFDVTIVDPDQGDVQGVEVIRGLGTAPNDLTAAGIGHAEGIVAGTDDDTANITMAIAARQLNPAIFVIARQNLVSRRLVFDALGADMTMVSSEIIANECLAILRTPNMSTFLRIVRARDNSWAQDVVERLQSIIGDQAPTFWNAALTKATAPGFVDAMTRSKRPATVRDLQRDITNRNATYLCLPLLMVRAGETIELPDDDVEFAVGDEILFAGSADAQSQMVHMLRNANTAEYIITGRDRSRSAVVRLMDRPDRADAR